ncbi:MAG: TIGR00282 family metallophosphoesterase [Alphaproteobacteria bacterium]
MKLLFLGDVVGRAGRTALSVRLRQLRGLLELDFIVANGENAAHGFGITPKICGELFDAGVDCITTGNHIWDRAEINDTLDREPRLLRPQNYGSNRPGRGFAIYETPRGQRIAVLNVMGRLFMDEVSDPFACVDETLAALRLGQDATAILVDIHAEATSEKVAIGHYCDGRATLVVGTHSHIPTADCRVLPRGTAYQTDAGMCGDYDSVIGMRKSASLDRFLGRRSPDRLEPAEGPATLCGVFVELDDRTGLAKRAAPLRLGGDLANQWPF